MLSRPKSVFALAALAATFLAASATQAAPITIDSFNGGSYSRSGTDALNGASGSLALVADVTGSVVVSHASPNPGTFGGVASSLFYNSMPFNGQLSLSASASGQIQVGLNYTLTGGTLALDVGGFLLDFAAIQAGINDDFDFQAIVNTTGGPLAAVNFVFPSGGASVISIDNASWHGVDITGFTFLFNTGDIGFASDFTLNEIRAQDGTFTITGDPVPEPASMAVFGALTLVGGVIAHRRMTRAAA